MVVLMVFDDQNVDVTGVDDRRGTGRGGALAIGGGGLGIIGVILVIALQLLGGGSGDVSGLQFPAGTEASGTGESTEQLKARCNTEGAIEKYDDCYLVKVYNEANEVWADEFARRGGDYRPPTLGFFEQATQTGCGTASSEVGPFYCPPDEELYFDLGFLTELQERFGAQGRYAQAYILAHEVGHHIQTLTGTEAQVRAAQQRNPDKANELSVKMELQADCYAGVWGRLANDRGNVAITEDQFNEALNAAAAVGDDRIQRAVQGRVDPESFTHGSAEQRRHWYLTGYQSGDVNACNTFG
jgi:predicted metalloprotease